jgi:hypothetical protein
MAASSFFLNPAASFSASSFAFFSTSLSSFARKPKSKRRKKLYWRILKLNGELLETITY